MIGERVRRRREELGLTSAQLAARASMAPSAVSQIETGKRSPSSTSVMKLAEALGVDAGDLYPKKAQSPLPLEDRPRAASGAIEVGEAYFMQPEKGEEPDAVTLRIYKVRLLEGDEPIVEAMREASPEEVEELREQLARVGDGAA
jgi:transcriptional regulator with XRE-family HTH domain